MHVNIYVLEYSDSIYLLLYFNLFLVFICFYSINMFMLLLKHLKSNNLKHKILKF